MGKRDDGASVLLKFLSENHRDVSTELGRKAVQLLSGRMVDNGSCVTGSISLPLRGAPRFKKVSHVLKGVDGSVGLILNNLDVSNGSNEQYALFVDPSPHKVNTPLVIANRIPFLSLALGSELPVYSYRAESGGEWTVMCGPHEVVRFNDSSFPSEIEAWLEKGVPHIAVRVGPKSVQRFYYTATGFFCYKNTEYEWVNRIGFSNGYLWVIEINKGKFQISTDVASSAWVGKTSASCPIVLHTITCVDGIPKFVLKSSISIGARDLLIQGKDTKEGFCIAMGRVFRSGNEIFFSPGENSTDTNAADVELLESDWRCSLSGHQGVKDVTRLANGHVAVLVQGEERTYQLLIADKETGSVIARRWVQKKNSRVSISGDARIGMVPHVGALMPLGQNSVAIKLFDEILVYRFEADKFPHKDGADFGLVVHAALPSMFIFRNLSDNDRDGLEGRMQTDAAIYFLLYDHVEK